MLLQRFMHFFGTFSDKEKKNNMSEHSNLRLGEYKKYKKINKTMKKKKIHRSCVGNVSDVKISNC